MKMPYAESFKLLTETQQEKETMMSFAYSANDINEMRKLGYSMSEARQQLEKRFLLKQVNKAYNQHDLKLLAEIVEHLVSRLP